MPNSKHIALVAYYWAPSGGSGVQRWLFLANYFVNNGVDVTVFTPKNPRVAETDTSLLAKVDPKINLVYVDGWEPLKQSKKAIGENIGQKKGVKSALMRFVRANFFIPDARVFWAKAAWKVFKAQHSQTPFDSLITTGPPHSLHLVGLRAKKHLNIPWIADFRDPWVGFFQNQSLPMCAFAKRKQQRLQQSVVQQSDRVVVTAPALAKDFLPTNPNTVVLTNGYEKQLQKADNASHGLVYSGSLKAQQNPRNLWRAILELVQESEVFASKFSLEIYGKVADAVKNEVAAYGIGKWVLFKGYQSKEQLDEILPNAKALLLLGIDMPNTHNIIHGKLFEYMAAKRPILGMGPQPSDMETLFDTHDLGVYTSFEDFKQIKDTLLNWFTADKTIPFESKNVEVFQRDGIAKAYLNVILACK